MYIVTPTEKQFTVKKENEFGKESMLDLRMLKYIFGVDFSSLRDIFSQPQNI